MNDTQNRLSPTTIVLHWLIAVLIIGMPAFGLYLMAAIVLHVAGAFKHHLLDKDHTLQRMFARVGRSS